MNLFIIAYLATATMLVLKLTNLVAIGWLTVLSPVIFVYSVMIVVLFVFFVVLNNR